MSGVLKGIGMVAGLVATVASFIPGGQLVSAIASGVAVVASIGAQIAASKPPVQGSSSQISIGGNMPSPCLIGESYYGGSRVKQVGYGEEDKVPNAHAWIVDIYSVAGPLTALVSSMCDFVPVSFVAAPDNNAVGYFHNNLHRHYHLGATPEPAALMPHWSGAPNWGPSSRLSGLAAMGWSARWPKDGKVFAAGFPQTGGIWQGVPAYDPRHDDTYPGGSGAQRWADPANATAFAAAKPTWPYTRCPSLHALRYCLGSWEREGSGPFQKVFGVGYKIDQVVIEDFVELANVCDANGWTVNGVLFEGQGISKWDNLKRILSAGGAQPVWKGGRLGLRINAPRIALTTITLDDIAEGEPIVPGTLAYETRKNTLIPKWIDPASKWELVPSAPVQVTEFVTEDGEERSEEFVLDLVTNPNQAARLAGYELVSRREQGPITLPLKPRFRHYPAGSLFDVDPAVMAAFGIRQPQLLAINKTTDIQAMSWTFSFATETATKHLYALGLTGTSPPAPYLPSTEDMDDASNGAVPIGPMPGDWALAGTTLTQNGAEIPALLVAGGVGVGNARDVLIDVRRVDVVSNEDGTPLLSEDGGALQVEGDPGAWTDDSILPETATQRIISNGIVPGAAYQVGIRYRAQAAIGERLILGPVLSGALGVPRGAHLIRSQTVSFPVSSADTSISVVDFVATLDDSRTVVMPATTLTGLANATTHGVFWSLATNSYAATPYPSLAEWASSDNVFLRWQTTSSSGVYPPGDPPPPGDGGGGNNCVTGDTMILVAENEERPASELVAGDVVFTRHERTLEWGSYPIAAISFVTEPVFKADGFPRATGAHRFLVNNRWVRMDQIGEPDGEAVVAKITVTEAHTYVSAGVLSHNIKENLLA